MLLIIDNQSSYLKKFKNSWLDESDIEYKVYDHNQPLWLPDSTTIDGIILSGGKGSPWEPLNLTTNYVALMQFDVPVLGFCLGHEIIAVAYGGRIKKLDTYRNKKELVKIHDMSDPIFEGMSTDTIMLREKHSFHVHQLSREFVTLGSSEVCPHEIIKHKTKPIYGFQSHPEVSGADGLRLVENFLKMCGLTAKDS